MNSKIVRVALGATVALALAVGGTTPAMANDADVIRRGSCSGSTDWKLKLSPDDGRIEVEYEVDSNVSGQRWQVRIKKNGARIFSGSRVTGPPSGSFEVRVLTSNPAGTDRFRARAVNAATGEICVGTASF
jgi:hypothetical protein